MKTTGWLVAAILACAAAVPAAEQWTGFPFQNETLRYRVVLPNGTGLDSAVALSAQKTDSGWDFDANATVNLPAWPLSDSYRASAAGFDLCSTSLRRELHHGKRRVTEKTDFDQSAGTARRETTYPLGGGTSTYGISTCGRDALTFFYYARREMGQGRVPQIGSVYLGPEYRQRMVYSGAVDIPIKGKPTTTDRVAVTLKGPASDLTLEIFYARDAARTPLLIRIPAGIGQVSLELVR